MADLKTTKEERAEMRSLMPASNYIANLTDDLDTLEAENADMRHKLSAMSATLEGLRSIRTSGEVMAENAALREALFHIATGRFISIDEACDIAEGALGKEAVAAWHAAENAKASKEPTP